MKRSIVVAGLLAIAGLAPGSARAEISYEYTTTLSVFGGPDSMMLNGATVQITFDVPDGSVYVNRSGLPEVVVDDPQVTISGSGLAANNGTFNLSPTAFFPFFGGTHAGFFTEPAGADQTIALPGGDTLLLEGNTVPTASAAAAVIGGTPLASDFGPTTSVSGVAFFDQNDQTEYHLNGTVITATGSVVPEPSSVVLMGLGGIGLGLAARRRIARSA